MSTRPLKGICLRDPASFKRSNAKIRRRVRFKRMSSITTDTCVSRSCPCGYARSVNGLLSRGSMLK